MYSVYLSELQNKEVLRQSEKFFFFPPPTNSDTGEAVPEHAQAHSGQIPLRSGERGPHAPGPTGLNAEQRPEPPKIRSQGGVCVGKGCGEEQAPAELRRGRYNQKRDFLGGGRGG